MPTQITGNAKSGTAPAVIATHNTPSDFVVADQTTQTFQHQTQQKYKNTGNVAQTLTVEAVDLTGSIVSVGLIFTGSMSNSITLQPGEDARLTIDQEVVIPATPTLPGEEAVTTPYSYNVVDTWTVA